MSRGTNAFRTQFAEFAKFLTRPRRLKSLSL